MKNRNKMFSYGILAIIISVMFINSFVQINLTSLLYGSTSDTIDSHPTIDFASNSSPIIYNPPTELTVTKSETVTIDLFPNGSIKTERVTVNFIFDNDGDENCSFDLIDRAEYCDLDTIKFQKGTFNETLEYEVISSDEDFGVAILKWSNIPVKARSRAKYGYSIVSYRPIPITVETEYYINGSLVDVDPELNAINASVGSRVSNIIRVRNIQQGLFSTSETVKPATLCLVTLMLPYEEEEEDRDIDEPIFDPAPIMSNIIGPIQQVSWAAFGDTYEINWTTVIRKGGGWGIIELQPLRFDLIQSSDLMGSLFDGLSGLLGLLAAQQAYWAGLTLMSMIEELQGMAGLLQMLLNDIQVQIGMLQMINYSLLNSLLMALIELDMARSSLYNMYEDVNSTFYSDIVNDYDIWDDVRAMFRTILGISEGVYTEGYWSNGSVIGLGVPYMSIPLTIKYLEDIERRIVASFGAQIIELMGSPAIINITDTINDYSIFINATVIRNPDNTTDFYTLIDVINLTMPINVLGIQIVSLNLSRHYEFELNNVPGDRPIFEAIDNYFGHPVLMDEIFPPGYHPSGSPGSDLPGFYTWILDMLQVGRSAIWWTLGNLTRSLATMMLLLDSSFSNETRALFNTTLLGSSPWDLTTPITLETGFQGISGLLDTFTEMEEQFKSPFGNLFSNLLPDTSSLNLPINNEQMELLDKFGFWTALKIYLDPVPRIRQLLNITIPLDLGNMTGGMNMTSMMGGLGLGKSAENGHMSDWNWTSEIVNEVIQTNIEEWPEYKRFEFKAFGDVNTKDVVLRRPLNYSIPAFHIKYSFKINDTNPIVSVVVVSENTTGDEVYAIQDHTMSEFTANTWYEFSYDLRSTEYWEYYDKSFNPEIIKRVELRIIPRTTNPIALDLDYLNFTHEILPYPYNLTMLDFYLVGDGVEILPNTTMWEKWTTGLMITALKTEDMTGDGIKDIIVGSNDGRIYLLNGSSGNQIWNFSAKGSIINIYLADVTGNSTPEILFGTDKGYLYIINSSKAIISNFSIGVTIDYLLFGNLTGNKDPEFIIGNDNNLTVYTSAGQLCWNRTLKGDIKAIVVSDLTGDGFYDLGITTSKYMIYALNGLNGTILWDYITEERPTHLVIGNFLGDSKKEFLYSTEKQYYVLLDGLQGSLLLNASTDSFIRGIYIANLTGDGYDDLILHTGEIISHNISAITFTPTPNLLWNFTSTYPFNVISPINYLSDSYDEIAVTTINNRLYVFNSSGSLLFNVSIPRGVTQISFDEITQEGLKDFAFGMPNNYVLVLNGTELQQYWITELGERIITFQFIRTNDTIQLLYNLPDPFSDMMDLYGISLTGTTEDLAALANFQLPISFDMLGTMGDLGETGSTSSSTTGLGGMGSIGTGGFSLSNINLTAIDIPFNGLGLLNMLEFEITLIQRLQDMKQVTSAQHAFTGLYEVRYTDKDTIDYKLYPIITDDTNAKYIQYKIRNYEEQPITVQYFALNMTLNGQPLPLDRISIEGWNGTHYVDLQHNDIYNITLAQLGLNYTNGKLIFSPFLKVEELEKKFVTVDWLGRELRIKINTSYINPNDLSIEPWIDISIELPGITIPGVSSVITYSKTHPTFLVTATPTPNITGEVEPKNLLYLLLTSPVFWSFMVVAIVAVSGFGYLQQREQNEVKKAASKKIIKWLKRREKSWQTLVKANIMTENQYYELKRIRYRIHNENLTKNQLELMSEKIISWKLIGDFISTVLLLRFWRGINKKSRLIWLLNTLEHMVLDPLKHAWDTFKTALGYLNPWDMNRQRKRELRKRVGNKRFWKKIEPPRKPIRKKRVEIIAPPLSKESIEEPKKFKKAKKVKKPVGKTKKSWDGEYRTDGGTLLKKISKAKKLPPIGSRDGQVFYILSKRKYVGMSLKEISKELEIPEYEVLISLIRLFEKGLIFLLQEGKTLSEDLWDVTTSLRKYDPELEKLIESIEDLEDEIGEGMEFLSTEITNEKTDHK